MSATIEVLIPNYNKVDFIEECLNSLTSQTYSKWRCIVVDGFSDDGSWEILCRYAQNDSRFELHQRKRNGLYDSWNFGLKLITAPYFCILTSDDIWPENWLEIALSGFKNYNSIKCVAARTRIIDEAGNKTGISVHNLMCEKHYGTDASLELRLGMRDVLAHYFMLTIYTSVHSLILKTEILKDVGLFSTDLGSVADYEWCMKIGCFGDILYHFDIEVGWRKYFGQATDQNNQIENGKNLIMIHNRNREMICQHLGDEIGNLFLKKAIEFDESVFKYHLFRTSIKNFKKNPLRGVKQMVFFCFKHPRELSTDILYKFMGENYFSTQSSRYLRIFDKMF
jgi:glycosyltransferase involved in cell wall biosynthesis